MLAFADAGSPRDLDEREVPPSGEGISLSVRPALALEGTRYSTSQTLARTAA